MFAALAEDRLFFLAEGTALLPLLLGDSVVGLTLPLVAKTLVEHQRQDVVLVILAGGLAPQDVRGAPEVGFELLQGQLHWPGCPLVMIPRCSARTGPGTPRSQSRVPWPGSGVASANASGTAPGSAALQRR